MSGKRILEGLQEIVDWTKGDGKLRVSTWSNGELTTSDLTFEEYLESSSSPDSPAPEQGRGR